MINPEQKAELLKMANGKAKVFADMREQGIHVWNLISTELYSDPAHCIFELLQNAEDEGATVVQLTLSERELKLVHRGRAFSVKDIKSICSVGDNREKKEKRNSIGRFGIGFKSVYSVTDKPTIRSGGIEFQIKNFIIPEFTFDAEDDGSTTITLPFGDDPELAANRFALLTAALQGMDHEYLLFLSSIERIQWSIEGPKGVEQGLLVRSQKSLDDTGLYDVSVNTSGELRQFIMGERPVDLPGKELSAKLALFYVLEEGQRRFEQVEASPLFAFFPTDLQTHLAFLVHAPFKTTPARDNIQEKDGGVNERLFIELSELLGDVVQQLGKAGLVDHSLWNILPCEKTNVKASTCYAALYQGLAKHCLTDKAPWLKASTGRFVAAGEIQTSSSPSITSLFTKEQSVKLFGRSYWLTADWVKTLDPDVLRFLHSELGVPCIEAATLKDHLTEAFIENATDAWLTKLYGHIQSTRTFAHWRTEQIIRTEDGALIAPFSKTGKRTVFRPVQGGSEYPCVKEALIQGETMQAFLDGMDIRPPKVVDEVTQLLIPKLKKRKQPYPKLKDHFLRILEALDEAKLGERTAILDDLRATGFLPAITGSGTRLLVRPDQCYYPSVALRMYFHALPDTVWLDLDYLGEIGKEERFAKFLGNFKMNSQPAKRAIPCHLSPDQIKGITGSGYVRSATDHDLIHLPEFLDQIDSLEKSVCLWNSLLAQGLPGRIKVDDLLLGWVVHGPQQGSARIPSLALEQLRTKDWLYSVNGELCCPGTLTIGELNNAYNLTSTEGASLIQHLQFKADVAAAFEAEHPNKKVVDKEKYERYLTWLKLQEEAEAKASARVPSVISALLDVNEVDGEIGEIEELTQAGDDMANPVHEPVVEFTPVVYGRQVQRTGGTDHSVAIALEQEDLGQWGEDWVAKILHDRCTATDGLELVSLNKGDMVGVGRDFQIYRDGKMIEVIEVKSTAYDVEAPVKLSRRQWEQAMHFHKANGPVSYWVYCVFLANTPRPKLRKVKDPVAKLNSGALFVDDIVLRITSERSPLT